MMKFIPYSFFDIFSAKRVFLIMASANYKKWVILALFVLIAVSVIIVMANSRKRAEKSRTQETRQSSSGPVIDPLAEKNMALDQIKELPETPEGLASLGDQYFEAGRFKEAIDTYEKAIELNPGDADSYNDMGLSFHYMGKSEAAVEAMRKGVEVDPSFQRIRLSLGFVLAALGKMEESVAALQKAVDMNPDSREGIEAKRILDMVKKDL
ncbi:MAG TPA: tetratricopeptide repeat protein [Nitrospirae bacterium]|nr:tetratricopeptide repeat protein [Nitrospirota bacterium]